MIIIKRYQETQKVGIFGIIGNLFLFIIKGTIGLVSHSQAMIADAVNSASDIFASIMTTIGNKIARVPEDKDHNFGHGKAEYLFSLFISLSMIVLSLKVLIDAIFSIIHKDTVIYSFPLLLTCVVTIVLKLILYLYTRHVYQKYPSILIKSNMCDHRNDCVITIFTLLSVVLSNYGIYFVDGVVGILISLWILYTGVRIFLESYHVLMDTSLSEEETSALEKLVLKHKKIKQVNEIYSIPIGYKYIVVLTIYVDGQMSTLESHTIADKLEQEIVRKMSQIQKAIVHVNPL